MFFCGINAENELSVYIKGQVRASGSQKRSENVLQEAKEEIQGGNFGPKNSKIAIFGVFYLIFGHFFRLFFFIIFFQN